MIDDGEARGTALLRFLFAAALVGAAHVGGFIWLASHNLSPPPPDAVRGAPIDIDLIAAAPPEPRHSAAPPAPPSQEPPPPTLQPRPSAEPPSPSPQPPPPSPEFPSPSPPPSPQPSPPSPSPTPDVPPKPEPSPMTPAPAKPEPSPTTPARPSAPTVPPDAIVAPAPPPKPRPRPSPRPTVAPQKLERARAAPRRSQRDAVADRASQDAPRPRSNGDRQGAAQLRASSGANLATWRGEVLARISEFKPSSSGATGTAVVAFTVDGGGRVISASLVRSSGNSGLDTASLAMVRRASPVPAPPPELGARVNLTVPVRYQ